MRVQVGSWGSAREAVLLALAAVAQARIGCSAAANVTFAALHRPLLDPLAEELSSRHGLTLSWHERCGLYMPARRDDGLTSPALPVLPPGARIRELRADDGELINSCWAYRSETSLSRVREIVSSGRPGCLGVETDDGRLVGWMVCYEDGALGMLHVEDSMRRRGYARALLAHAQVALQACGAPCFAYIVDTNAPSRALFNSLGWERVADADWVGFAC